MPPLQLAEEVETQLKAYRAAVEEINNKTNAGPQVGMNMRDAIIVKGEGSFALTTSGSSTKLVHRRLQIVKGTAALSPPIRTECPTIRTTSSNATPRI